MATPALRYAPEFQLRINDEPVPAALRASIVSVSFQTGLEGADRVDLSIFNENLRWLDHPLLRLDNKLALSMGYAPDPLQQMFVGEVVSITPSFPASGSPMLMLSAQDKRNRLQRGSKTRWFAVPAQCRGNFPVPDNAVASIVAGENALIPIIDPIGAALAVVIGGIQTAVTFGDPDARQKTIRRQSAESDYDFLRRLCVENAWEMIMEHQGQTGGRRLRFLSTIGARDPAAILRYGASLLEFNPRISNVGQVLRVAGSFWVPSINTEFTVAAGWDRDRSALSLDISPGYGAPSGGGNQDAVTVLSEPLNADTAPRVLVAKLLAKLNSRLTGTGRCIGDPRIQAGSVLRIEGVGEQFGGLYRVTSATHTIDGGGYQTSFDLRKEVWFGSVPLLEQGAVKVDVLGQSLRIGSSA